MLKYIFIFLSSTVTCIQADLFDLYELSHLRDTPIEIQQQIATYCNQPSCSVYRTTLGSKKVEGVEFLASDTIGILIDNTTHIYKLYPQSDFQLCFVELRDPFTITPVRLGPWYEDLYKNINVVISTTKSFTTSFDLQSNSKRVKSISFIQRDSQWYLYKEIDLVGDSLDQDSWRLEPLENIVTNPHLATIKAYNHTIVDVWKCKDTSWQPIAHLNHPETVYAASFSDDYTQLVTACQDNKIRIWSIPFCKVTTLVQALLLKLIDTAYRHHSSCTLSSLAKQFYASLSKNLLEPTLDGVTAYLTSIFNSFDEDNKQALVNHYFSKNYQH